MKREILCQSCEEKVRKLFPVESPYPGEHIKLVNGKSLKNMVCDGCDKFIIEGEAVCAFSIWADYGGVPYYSWESDFIEIDCKMGVCKDGNE